MTRRFSLLLALGCCTAALCVAGCGSSSSSTSSASSPTTSASASSETTTSESSTLSGSLQTTKFVFHAGLGFGAFHRWIYKPFKAGDFSHPLSNKVTLVKAGLAAAFVYHELKLAASNAENSKLLHPLVAPINDVADKLKSLKGSVTNGSVNSNDLDGINSQLSSIASMASSKGATIKESVPSAAQLTSPPSGP